MPRTRWRDLITGLGALAGSLLVVPGASAQGPAMPSPQAPQVPVGSVGQLVRMDPASLDALYRQSAVGPIPSGRVRGTAISYAGTALAAPASQVARLVWQGKVFLPCGDTVVNKFFGVRAVKGRVYYGESWLDGGPALIIDYSGTSLVYAHYRDEIREVAPGLYLGLMYTRTCPPKLKTYFVLEAPRCP
jgi:hypothetical protein